MSSVFLEVGNPKANKPATFSRFILPFSYRDYKNNSTPSAWQKIDFADDSEEYAVRKSYFTKETSDVLFNQSSYFRYVEKNVNPFLTIDYKGFQICFNSPQIVLFAFESPQTESLLKTGFLVHELYFKDAQSVPFEILLEINELFRYKECPFKDHKNELTDIFYAELSEKLSIENNTKQDSYFHWELILKSFFSKDYLLKEFISKNSKNSHNINVSSNDIYADNRTFVWSCAVIEGGTTALQNRFKFALDFAENSWETKNFGHLVKFLNVDRSRSDVDRLKNAAFNSAEVHSTTEFEREWASEKTYKRWEKAGSFYGFSYHSGVALVPTMKNKYADNSLVYEPPLWKHWGQMYFDIILLLFYTRVSLFRFSNKLTEISLEALNTQENENEKWSESFGRLRLDFTLFTNLFRFPLISNQQQAIEMFDIAKSSLDIDEFYNEIQQEIHSSQEFIEQRLEKEQNKILLSLQEEQKTQISKLTRLQEAQEKQSSAAKEQTQVTTLLTVMATLGLIFSIAIAIWSGYITETSAFVQIQYLTDFKWANRLFILCVTVAVSLFFIVFAYPVFWALRYLMKLVFKEEKDGKNEDE